MRACSTRSLSAFPMHAGVSALSPSWRPAAAPHRRHSRRCRRTHAVRSRVTRCRASWSWSKPSSGHRRGSPITAGPVRSRAQRWVRSTRDENMTNRLGKETSPYLRQHADNPVDWYPWGEEAFALARERDVPVFLSIGYSSCHWCHVMAHESFEDDATAELMNRLFVNVKVDREERPDVDAIYMQSVQALTGRGGWPMSVWCTPDARPFYAGTYFPNAERHGMPSFARVCDAVAEAWRERRSEVTAQSEQLTAALA